MVVYARINKTKQSKEADAEFSILMAVTRRFDIQTFLETCYGFEKRREAVCTKIEALGYYGKNPVLQRM